MIGQREERRIRLRWLTAIAAVGLATGCDGSDQGTTGIIGSRLDPPTQLAARYHWLFQGWQAGQPVGQPSVSVTWTIPASWSGEAFRVYARRSGQTDTRLIATVTSCAGTSCRYTDINVRSGATYEYFVTAVDERSGRESDRSASRSVQVPASALPQAPGAPRAVALDGAVFLQWAPTGASRYRVILEAENGSDLIDIGETDGSGYLDTRATNGSRYRYRLAAEDTLGQVSALSPVRVAVPRPDYHAELIYAFADSAAASGFRFVASDSLNPIVPGSSADAQLRLQVVNGRLSLVPLGTTTVTSGVLTTALTCGPGSDADCFAIASANDTRAPKDFASEPVAVAAELTYLVKVRGSDGRNRFGKIRVTLEGEDQRGRDLVIFDWAYQLIPDEPSLSRRSH